MAKKVKWNHPLLEKYHAQLDLDNGKGWSARINSKIRPSTLDGVLYTERDYWNGGGERCYVNVNDSYYDFECLEFNCGIAEMPAGGIKNSKQLTLAVEAAVLGNYGIIIVSLNRAQAKKRPMFLRAGFKIANDWTRNPNSGNDICLLTKDLNDE